MMADTPAHAHETAHAEAHSGHPTWKTYVVIGAILTVITAIEVAIFYIPALENVITPTLLVLSGAKFLIVVLFYMHLKFDNPIFGRVFWAPFFLAVLVILGMIILFKVLPKYQF
ncbi:MAG: cytochrome C oxidase subunit IV family protein [Gemmatimonadota bacterium]